MTFEWPVARDWDRDLDECPSCGTEIEEREDVRMCPNSGDGHAYIVRKASCSGGDDDS